MVGTQQLERQYEQRNKNTVGLHDKSKEIEFQVAIQVFEGESTVNCHTRNFHFFQFEKDNGESPSFSTET